MQSQKQLPVLLPSRGILKYFMRALYSISNFTKASILSIVILLAIFVLLTQMEQAFTMLLRMIEEDGASLLLCFLMLNLLATGLSHYPIYTYYAGNLNGSRKYIRWKKTYPYKSPILKRIRIYTFEEIVHPNYVKDIYANILRQFLGLSLFFVWIHFIFSAFEPNLRYSVENIAGVKWLVYTGAILPFITYGILRRRVSRFHSSSERRKKTYKIIGLLFCLSAISSVILLIIITNKNQLFSKGGLLLLLLTTYAMMFNFAFFRLFRPRIRQVISELRLFSNGNSAKFLAFFKPLQSSVHYLVIFQIGFYLSIFSIVYFNLASIADWKLPNGIAIVFVYLYFFFFIVASLGKYYFVQFSLAQREKDEGKTATVLNRKPFLYFTGSLIVLAVIFVAGFFTESTLNELTIRKLYDGQNGLALEEYQKRVQAMPDTLFFVTSHGGGLKANAWTLMVLNELQKETNGSFMKQTVAFSGASGGSLGLALYGNLYGLYGNDFNTIDERINAIRQEEDYAALDVSMLFGLDAGRIFYPLNGIPNSKDRSYFGMLKYQNHVHKTEAKKLDITPFRRYWQQLEKNGNLLPTLIMNTSSTSGRRGIFCSLDVSEFDSIFPYSQNLGDVKCADGSYGSISFYQAVSTTNRFPIFSPAAKIKGKGHFIDAGAIDNSGILGCWDLYLYLRENGMLLNKVIVFVDIDNSKTGYAEQLLKKFMIASMKKGKTFTLTKDEYEKSAIMANLQTGLSLNKIPGYLNDFMRNYSSTQPNIHFNRIMLPHKVAIDDLEAIINGEIQEGEFKTELAKFLDAHNTKILTHTEQKKGFWQSWECYEPVLSRQLSESNNVYFDKILRSEFTGIPELYSFIHNN